MRVCDTASHNFTPTGVNVVGFELISHGRCKRETGVSRIIPPAEDTLLRSETQRVGVALYVEQQRVPKVFSQRTLLEFENASASVPLRQIDRAFGRVAIGLGKNPDESGGSRRTQFRRYIASVDQNNPQQLDRLGDALGALIEEVAASKQGFLVNAAERDGFSFANGIFTPAATAASSFAVLRGEDLATIDDRGRRLHLVANDSPNDAIAGAKELIESVCRTVLLLIGEPAPGEGVGLGKIAESTLDVLDVVSTDGDSANSRTTLVRKCLGQLAEIVANLNSLEQFHGPDNRRDGNPESFTQRHARLAVGAALTVAGFVSETYAERAVPSGERNGNR